jgi:uncharacterized membrane protein
MSYRAISGMSTGAVLFTLGAILYFAVTADVQGFDVNAAGAILMIVGLVVAMVALLWGMTEGLRVRSHVVETRHAAPPPAQPAVRERPQRVVVESRTVDEDPVH